MAPVPNDAHSDLQFQLVGILRPLARRAGLLGRAASDVGRPTDFRVPDLTFLRGRRDPVWNPTAAIVVEIVSPATREPEVAAIDWPV